MQVSDLCTPAMLYFFVSLFSLAISAFQKFNIMSLLIKAFFIFFWTWILNLLCTNGLKIVSWILVLLPFLVYFLHPF